MGKDYKKWFLVFGLIVTFVAGSVLAVGANTVNITVNNAQPLEQTGDNARVNWEQGSESTIEAMGVGFPPKNFTNMSYGQQMARTAAITVAQRNLLEIIQGVQVDSEKTVEDLRVSSDVIKTRVSGMVRGAKVVREAPLNDGSGGYMVVLSMNMYGANSLAEVAYTAIKPAQIEDFPKPSPDFQYKPADIQSPVSPVRPVSPVAGGYTGVIVDAGGLGLQPTFSPRLYDESGNIVYGNKYIDPDFAIKHGMVEYLQAGNVANAAANGSTRAGKNPLVVRAVKLADNNYNVVISNADAQKILASHDREGFLARCAVVFAK